MKIIDTGRQAIRTYYIGPSNVKGSRIAVMTERGRRYYGHDAAGEADPLGKQDSHRGALALYVKEAGWTDHDWIGAGFHDCIVWVPLIVD